MIALIAAQKGGCGLTALAINIATELAIKGRDVILVDADRQSSSSEWWSERKSNPALPKSACVDKYGEIHAAVYRTDYGVYQPGNIRDCRGKGRCCKLSSTKANHLNNP